MADATVVIPIYKVLPSKLEIVSLIQCCDILAHHQFSLICPFGLDIGFYEKIFKNYKINFNVARFDPKYFNSVAGYNRLMLEKCFYEKYENTDFILIYQLDAYVFSDDLEFWCNQGYDYIGAPWFEGYDACNSKSRLLNDAGNGGFSLRKVNSFINLLNLGGKPGEAIQKFIKNGANEDGFFSCHAKQIAKNFKVAAPEVSMRFSFECLPEKLYQMTGHQIPFGCHAWEKYNPKFWLQFIQSDYLDDELRGVLLSKGKPKNIWVVAFRWLRHKICRNN